MEVLVQEGTWPASARNNNGTSLQRMSRNTPPAHPVIIPDTITIGSDASTCQATSQPAMVKTTRPMASSTRNPSIQPVHDAGNQDGREGSDRRQPEIRRILHPQQGIMPEQDIADGAAAKRGDAAQQADPDPVHAAAPGGERRRHRLRRERHQRQRI